MAAARDKTLARAETPRETIVLHRHPGTWVATATATAIVLVIVGFALASAMTNKGFE
jgi:hypothetical protein